MDFEHDSNSISEEDASYDHFEGIENVLDSNPIPDIFTASADPSGLRMTTDVSSEMVLDSLLDLGLELERGVVDMEELDHHTFLTSPENISAPIFLDDTHSRTTNADTLTASTNFSLFPNSESHLPPNPRELNGEELPPPAREPTWRTILTLENVQPETLNSIMQIVIQSRTKVTLESHQ